MNAYDVIIVGSGAGGGTLARHLAPSGKRILLLERGDWLPREPQNWSAQDVFVDNRYVSPDTWYDASASRSSPRSTTTSAARRSSTAPRSTACGPRTSASCSHHDGVSPAWPIAYDELEPYYTMAEQLYEVHGARGEDPTEPPASAPYPFPAVSHEPRIQQLSDDLAAAGFHAVPRALRRAAERVEHALQRLRSLHGLRRLPVRSSTASRTPRCSACGRRSSIPTSRCWSTPESSASRPMPAAAASPRLSSRATARRSATPPTWWCSPAAQRTPPRSYSVGK